MHTFPESERQWIKALCRKNQHSLDQKAHLREPVNLIECYREPKRSKVKEFNLQKSIIQLNRPQPKKEEKKTHQLSLQQKNKQT